MSHTRRNGVASHRWIQTGERDRLAACMSGKNEKQTAVPTMRLSHSRPGHEGTGRLRHGFTPPWGSGAPLGGPGTCRVSAIHRCGSPSELGQGMGLTATSVPGHSVAPRASPESDAEVVSDLETLRHRYEELTRFFSAATTAGDAIVFMLA